MRFVFAERSPNHIVLQVKGQPKTYKLKYLIAFDSYRKMMSQLVKTPEGKYVFYIKGSASALMSRLKFRVNHDEQIQTIANVCSKYNQQGLRTMIFAKHVMSKREYYECKRIIATRGNSHKLDSYLYKYE